jgi:PGF-CTERM protein
MRPETVLGGGAVVALVAMLALGLVAPGAIASSDGSERDPPGQLSIREVSIAPGQVSGATATLRVDARVTHRGGDSENVAVEFRAVDAESGLVETTRTVPVGNLTRTGERRVLANLSVDRSGGYRIETVLYRDGERVDLGARSVSGVGSLEPDYESVGIGFHDFENERAQFPSVEYSIERVGDGRVTLDVSAYVTNAGDAAASDLEMVVVARQTGSSIVADRATIEVPEIRPGRTLTPSVELAVPDGYGYYLDAMIKRDDVIVSTARAGADLSPGENGSVEVDRSNDEDGLKVGEFADGDDDGIGPGDGESNRRETETVSGGGGPGFGPAVAVVATLAIAVIARRKRDD